MIRKTIILSYLVFQVCMIHAQEKPFTGTKNKKAENLFIEAVNLSAQGDNQQAFFKLKDCLQRDSNFIDAWMLVADIREQNEQYLEALTVYKKVIAINSDFQIPYYKLANTALSEGEYKLALENIGIYKDKNGMQIEPAKVKRVERVANFGFEATKHPVLFDPKNLGAGINSPLNEYFPGVSADGKTLIYTRLDGGQNEEFYISKWNNNSWTPSRNMRSPVNTEQNEGTISISSDGQYIFFTGCNRPQGEGSCDLYFSALDGDTWREPKNLGFPLNTRAWETQPSVSFDGKTLYFASSRSGGFGESDLWYTTYNKGKWSAPVNLGPEINTPGSEQSPFIAKDDQTLYFISDYHDGMGGMDIFISRKQPDGRWGKAVNIGYPINTHGDEMCITLTADGEMAYIASDRKDGFGGLDIYGFVLYEEARPKKTAYVQGVVYDAKTLKKLKARIELIDIETNKTVIEATSNKLTGEFLFCLQGNKNYALNVSCEGYLFYSENFSLKAHSLTEPLKLDVPLNPILEGEKAVLRNVFFDVDKFDLKPESKTELDKLIQLLKANPRMKIEVGGHTDNTGVKQKNIELSNNRAKSVANYLVANGIEANRLTYKGYADTQPIADNKTEVGRRQNRRTEFKIISLQ
jgi:outer membrane protein OmpA-like peptidoglycan-associated protein